VGFPAGRPSPLRSLHSRKLRRKKAGEYDIILPMNDFILKGCSGATEGLWMMGWLFTIGFLHLSFWKGVLAIIIWPYYLGVQIAKRLRRK